jgi:RNA polymerase sigma factor (sigma-70 family)
MQTNADGSEQLAQQYAHRVGFFANKVARMFSLGNCWEAELVSAGYWGLAKALDNRRPDASRRELSAYVSQRIVGAVIDEARSCLDRAYKEAGRPASELASDLESWGNPGRSPEQAVVDRSLWEQIDRALSVLDIEQRRMVRSYLLGTSLTEMAERQGIPMGTMRARFERAARLLRGRAPHIRRVLREAGS